MGQLRKGPEQGKKHIPAPEAVVLNECEGFRRGRGVLLTAPRGLVMLHEWARPDGVLLIGEGLAGSTGGASDCLGWALPEPEVSLSFWL